MPQARRQKPSILATALVISALPGLAPAHSSWILPSATVLSGPNPWVTFDAAVSEDIFHVDGSALRLDDLLVLQPDGSTGKAENIGSGKFRNVFDVNLVQKGTWKIQAASSGYSARWEENGQRKSWPPRPAPGVAPLAATAENLARDVPKAADKLAITYTYRRVETFVTAGAPTDTVLQAKNSGFEMLPITHPNDLYAGETATFRFLIDGKPAAGAKVEVIAAGRRYRDAANAVELVADAAGLVKITWPAAGPYWLGATYEDNAAPAPAGKRTGTYSASFEVLSQ